MNFLVLCKFSSPILFPDVIFVPVDTFSDQWLGEGSVNFDQDFLIFQATGVTTARGHDLSDHPQFAKGDFFISNSINIRNYCQFTRKEERIKKETLSENTS